ncbi:MAG: nucleotidyltransferase domain-containing protein [Sporichthyaceae bacterium]|nr:nucleotidyltransferase domain-containing protein [Sporichthyaceae bacterium]
MTSASTPAHRMAERATGWAQEHAAVRAAIVYGSLAHGLADEWSDLDLVLVAEPGRRDELWAQRAQFAEVVLGVAPVWSHELPWQRAYRYQAWDADGAELDLTVDEEQVTPAAVHTRGFRALVDRAGVADRLTAALAGWRAPEFDAAGHDGGTWAWLLWLHGRLRHGERWVVRYGLHDTLTSRVIPLLGSAWHSAHRELGDEVIDRLNAVAPASADEAELRRALLETAWLYDWAMDRWAERTGQPRPAMPLREIALRQLAVPVGAGPGVAGQS